MAFKILVTNQELRDKGLPPVEKTIPVKGNDQLNVFLELAAKQGYEVLEVEELDQSVQDIKVSPFREGLKKGLSFNLNDEAADTLDSKRDLSDPGRGKYTRAIQHVAERQDPAYFSLGEWIGGIPGKVVGPAKLKGIAAAVSTPIDWIARKLGENPEEKKQVEEYKPVIKTLPWGGKVKEHLPSPLEVIKQQEEDADEQALQTIRDYVSRRYKDGQQIDGSYGSTPLLNESQMKTLKNMTNEFLYPGSPEIDDSEIDMNKELMKRKLKTKK